MKYIVYGMVTIGLTMSVEAGSPEEAKERAEEEWSGLSDYCGNGALSGRLIGHAEENLTIEAGDDVPEWTEAVPE